MEEINLKKIKMTSVFRTLCIQLVFLLIMTLSFLLVQDRRQYYASQYVYYNAAIVLGFVAFLIAIIVYLILMAYGKSDSYIIYNVLVKIVSIAIFALFLLEVFYYTWFSANSHRTNFYL